MSIRIAEVAQVSKPAVSPTSKSAGRGIIRAATVLRTGGRFGNLRHSRFGNLRYLRSPSLCVAACCFLPFILLPELRAQTLPEATLAKISLHQKLNQQVSLDLSFRGEDGKPVLLGNQFGKRPVILMLGYYECPMLCTLALNGLVETLQELKWTVGKEFSVVCVSINPSETPTLAAAKKRTYLKRYGRPTGAEGWHFLTGGESAIQ